MAGGEFPDGSASRSMWRYDPCIDKWQEMASMNMPRSELGTENILFSLSDFLISSKICTIIMYNKQAVRGITYSSIDRN